MLQTILLCKIFHNPLFWRKRRDINLNEYIPRWNCSLHVVEETFSIVNCGIFKSDEIETGFSFWLQYSCNSLVVFETEIYHTKNFSILHFWHVYKDTKMPFQNFVFSLILTWCNLHSADLSIQRIPRKLHHAWKLQS